MSPKNILIFLLLCLACAPALAQVLNPEDIGKPDLSGPELRGLGVPELRKTANRAFVEQDYPAFRNAMVQLNRLRPYNSEYMYQLVLAYALVNERRPAFNMMVQMQRQGLSYDFDLAPESGVLRQTQLYDYLNRLMKDAGQPRGDVAEVARLDASVVLPEAIDWDPVRKKFLVGTIRDGLILAVGDDGSIEELVRADRQNGVWGIYGIAVDAGRNRLYASSTANQNFSGFDPIDRGRSALLEFQLDSMELLHRYPVPIDGKPHNLGNIAVTPEGTVYAADSLIPVIYTLPAGEERLRPYFSAPTLVNLRGMTLSGDGERLYFADYEMGIIGIDLSSGRAFNLGHDDTLNLGGIDGLVSWNDELVIIQNGIEPERILRLRLAPGGTEVAAVYTLAVNHPLFEAPNYGVVIGDELFFFANSQWVSDVPVEVVLARANIAEAIILSDPAMDDLMKQREKALERQQPASSEAPDARDNGGGGPG